MEIKQPEVTEVLDIPGSKKKIEIAWDPCSLEVDSETKELVFRFLQNGYVYLFEVLGEDSLLGMKNILRLAHAKKHGAAGLEMRVNLDELTDERPELEQSLFIHEIIHHLFPEEDLSMFIEMIYMLDKGQKWRFSDMKRILKEGKFTSPYLKGFKQISEWLGFDDIEKMLETFPTMDVVELKRIFKEKYEEYCENDVCLVDQLAKFRQSFKSVPGNIL